MVAQLATTRCDTTHRSARPSKMIGDAVPADGGSSCDDPAWRDLFRPILAKLKRSLANRRARVKTYVGTAAAAVLIGAIPWPHQISCEVVCEPAIRRFVTAPFDARLLKAHAKAGQQVRAGQLLASLDGSELRSELATKRAKFAQAKQRQLGALATSDHSKAENERLEVEYLEQEIKLLERRQQQLEVRSPIDGVVITGDLERIAGAPLSVGDSLFEIASLDRLIAEVAVPEQEVSFVDSAMTVKVALDAAPGWSQESTIEHVHLRSELRNQDSVFIAEAELENHDELLRPGMNGSACIHAGHAPLGWVLLHRPYEAARQWIGW